MKVHVKTLNLKGSDCVVNVVESDRVIRLKELVAIKLDVPVSSQRLVHRGKPLSDEWTLKQCGVKDGTKLFLALKKEDGSGGSGDSRSKLNMSDELHYFLLKHYRQTDAKLIMEEFRKIFDRSIYGLSLDDIERMATLNLKKNDT